MIGGGEDHGPARSSKKPFPKQVKFQEASLFAPNPRWRTSVESFAPEIPQAKIPYQVLDINKSWRLQEE